MNGLARLAARCDRLARRLSLLLTAISALAIAAVVLILVFSSAQRYLLAHPFPVTEEIAAYLFVVLSFAALVGGLVEGRHIRLLPLFVRLPGAMQRWTMLLGHLAALVVLAFLIRETFAFAWSSHRFGTRSYVADLQEWPWMMVIPVSLALMALVLLLRIVADLDRALRRLPVPEAKSSHADEAL